MWITKYYWQDNYGGLWLSISSLRPSFLWILKHMAGLSRGQRSFWNCLLNFWPILCLMLPQTFDEEMYLEDAQAQFLHSFVPHALLFASCADLLQAFATSAMVDNTKENHARPIQSHPQTEDALSHTSKRLIALPAIYNRQASTKKAHHNWKKTQSLHLCNGLVIISTVC